MSTTDEWRAVAAATGRADRAAAEAAARTAYETAGLVAPPRFVWVESPLAAVAAVRELDEPGRSVRDAVRTRVWAAERQRVYAELGAAGWAERWNSTGAQLWDTTRALTDRIRGAVVEQLVGPDPDVLAEADIELEIDHDARKDYVATASEVRGVLLDAVLGQHDAAWLAVFDDSAALAGLAGVARNAHWWWPFENAVVFCERPELLLRDEAGRLHGVTGPALRYADGFALLAWHGMPVPTDFLAELESLSPERIRAEDNAELRRVMLEHFGYDRYLAESNAEPVHRDETGILWRIPLPGDEDVVMVEVVNSTAEPDGTFNTYWLRVPPTTNTAKEGVAWTFGLEAAEYDPLRQT
ncbi:DUF6745 domain-containing protein [Nocardia yamanashiensis]|uniref:DUF6745 domain-containing protein n=1 Tax=Nocardia yamanashiensis TaxID=209247 RepID=UPI0008360C94|nr:hypothetical protein [Nocardia yamanashiensis]